MLTFLFGAFIGGLVIGALARLVVPGPNPIGFWWTVLCGVGGSLIGGSIGHALFRSWFFVFGLEVLAAAVLVAFVTNAGGTGLDAPSSPRRPPPGAPRR